MNDYWLKTCSWREKIYFMFLIMTDTYSVQRKCNWCKSIYNTIVRDIPQSMMFTKEDIEKIIYHRLICEWVDCWNCSKNIIKFYTNNIT